MHVSWHVSWHVLGRVSYMCCDVWHAETGGIVIAPRPSPDSSHGKPGYPMRPFWGILPELYKKVCQKQNAMLLGRTCID